AAIDGAGGERRSLGRGGDANNCMSDRLRLELSRPHVAPFLVRARLLSTAAPSTGGTMDGTNMIPRLLDQPALDKIADPLSPAVKGPYALARYAGAHPKT